MNLPMAARPASFSVSTTLACGLEEFKSLAIKSLTSLMKSENSSGDSSRSCSATCVAFEAVWR